MGDKAVFRSLRELFPQVDLRILKAVAIEHSRDVDAAVEFILSEVLPSLSGSYEESYTHHDKPGEHPTAQVELNKSTVPLGGTGVEGVEKNLLPVPVPDSVSYIATPFDDHLSLDHAKSLCMDELISQGSEDGHVTNTKELCGLISCKEVVEEVNASLPSDAKSTEYEMNLLYKNNSSHFGSYLVESKTYGSPSSVDGGNRYDQLTVQSEDTVLAVNENDQNSSPVMENQYLMEYSATIEKNIEYAMNLLHKNNSSHFGSYLVESKTCGSPSSVDGGNRYDQLTVQSEDTVLAVNENDQNSSPVMENQYLMEYSATIEKNIDSSVSEYELSQYPNLSTGFQDLHDSECSGTVSDVFASLSSSAVENLMDAVKVGSEAQNDVRISTTAHEKELLTCLPENVSDSVSLENVLVAPESVADFMTFEDVPSAHVSHRPSTIATRSDHIVCIDYFEEYISGANSHKEALASAVETASNMLKEVELLEERAKQSKEVASMAGQNKLSEVEDLKQMLKHTKEANDMHAGEVYGETAILAAEARELQSRVLNLSNEKNKYLSIIEEIHHTLEARLVTAQKDIQAAEKEKLEHEELAQKALDEQQAIVDTVVEESKKLQHYAEENSKLRDFLMDRGRMVDILQGEIRVIFEDVLSLKDKVDGQVPLGRSRSLTASSLASSSSSYIGKNTTLDSVFQPVESAERPQITEQEHLETQQVESIGSSQADVYHCDKQKILSDDEWELFELEN